MSEHLSLLERATIDSKKWSRSLLCIVHPTTSVSYSASLRTHDLAFLA